MSRTFRAAIAVATLALVAPPLYAQQSEPNVETYELPRGWVNKPPAGILGEPSILAKLAMSTDTTIGGEPRDGLYAQTSDMITGAGWISAGAEEKRALAAMSEADVHGSELAGEPIQHVLTVAPGNQQPIGGIKVVTSNGWFAVRPSGTEHIYKIYAESFRGEAHLQRIEADARAIVAQAIARRRNATDLSPDRR